MKRYEDPTITITMFDVEDVVTDASVQSAEEQAKAALTDVSVGVKSTNVKTVTWNEIISG